MPAIPRVPYYLRVKVVARAPPLFSRFWVQTRTKMHIGLVRTVDLSAFAGQTVYILLKPLITVKQAW
jgi:hypothetical protein